jgi:phosphoribosylaminoimidazole-succinocarboxamide synthase
MVTSYFTNPINHYKGKVREVYTIDNELVVLISTNRISAFDVILPKPIPYKGQVLNQIAATMLEATRDICPNWFICSPTPIASIGKKCIPFKIEMVIRGNLTGHAWRTYNSGKRELCGIALKEGMHENDFFDTPIITPSTKAVEGHDEDITATAIIEQGLATKEEWEVLCKYTYALFERGKALAAKQGLILVDTKYEFGKIGDTIYLMDEIHTPDSSRYFYSDGFEERQQKGEKQKQLSKEFVREWLLANDFMGKDGQTIPDMGVDWVNEISHKYIELYEKLIGEKFNPQSISETENIEILENTIHQLKQP